MFAGILTVFGCGVAYLFAKSFLALVFVRIANGAGMFLVMASAMVILISIIPNLIPLVITAGIMGFFGIPIKPSTALIFSIAFGISVDDSIHTFAQRADSLGYLGRDGYSLDGIFFDIASNESLEENR